MTLFRSIRYISTTIPKRPIPEKAFKKKPSDPAKKRLQDYKNYVREQRAIRNMNDCMSFGDSFKMWDESFPSENWTQEKQDQWLKTWDKIEGDIISERTWWKKNTPTK